MKAATPAFARKPHNNSKYRPDYVAQVQELCRVGTTDTMLADHFGVSRETIINWKKTYPEFRAAVLNSKKNAEIEVTASLYQATLDRVITLRQAIKCKEIYYDENGKRVEKERVEIVEVEKHIPADFRSQQFWLRNRNPKQWNEKYDDTDDLQQRGVTLNLGFGQNPLGDDEAAG